MPSTTSLFLLLCRSKTAVYSAAAFALLAPHWLWRQTSWPVTAGAWLGSQWDWVQLPWLTAVAGVLGLAGWRQQVLARNSISAKSMYSAVFRTLPDAAGITAMKDGRFIDVNPAFCNMLGKPYEHIVGHTNFELQIYATPNERTRLLDELSAKGKAESLRILCQNDEEIVPGTISAVPIHFNDEDCMLFVFHDMRTHERTVQDLHASNRLLQQAGHLARLGAWEDHRGQGLVYWSDVCYDIHGLPRNSPLPRDYINTFVAPEHRDHMRSQLQHCLRARQDWEIEIQIVRTDGSRLWVRSRGEAVLDHDGRIMSMRGVMQDIDGQKRQEEALLEREALISVTLEAASLGRWDWDLSSGMINGDSFWQKLNGLHALEGPPSLGQARDQWHWTELISSHDVPRSNNELIRHIENPEDGPFDLIWRLQPTGQRARWLRSMGKVVSHDAHGRALRMLGVCLDVTAQQEQKNNLQQLAHFDALTGLANRVELSSQLNAALIAARQSVQLLAVVYLDLDGFKPVNDRLGHAAGDRLLVIVAKRLQNALRTHDCVSRFGGDEFVLLLSQLHSREQCEVLLRRIMESLSRPYSIDGEKVHVTATMGYTLYPEDDSDAQALIRHADQAMYEAKQAGRNRIYAFDSHLERSRKEQRIKNLRIREGLENQEFSLYLQPKVDMRAKSIIGVEALARWHHPERGLLLPEEFLPMIEGTELELQFGEWAIKAALDTIEQFLQTDRHIQVAVNISARHLQRPGFAQWVIAQLKARPHLPASLLDLEITETAALYDVHYVGSVLKALRELKVSVSLDDFGTGYSSLTYLRSLPLDSLKIDRSFVRDMMNDPGDFAIVHGVASLARSFGYSVVAEGVESFDQCQMLERIGCHLAQGYYFAQPMPSQELTQWLQKWERPSVAQA